MRINNHKIDRLKMEALSKNKTTSEHHLTNSIKKKKKIIINILISTDAKHRLNKTLLEKNNYL